MALIPRVCGTIVSIQPLEHHYYKTEIVLEGVTGFSDYATFEDPVTAPSPLRLRVNSDQVPFSVGDRVRAIAFPTCEEGVWEAEGISKVR